MKAIVFDFDGTLTQNRKGSNCWYEIWKYINDIDYDNYLYNLYMNKEIDENEWFNLIIQRYKKTGVKREYLKNISKTIEILPKTYETIKYLFENNVKIFILSGGIRQIICDILKREKIDKFITSVEAYDLVFDTDGKLIDYKRPVIHNLENKNEYVEIIKKQYNIKSDDILFVGNGSNDEKVYLSGVKTLCINPDDADINNKVVWTYVIENCDSLMQIIEYCKV